MINGERCKTICYEHDLCRGFILKALWLLQQRLRDNESQFTERILPRCTSCTGWSRKNCNNINGTAEPDIIITSFRWRKFTPKVFITFYPIQIRLTAVTLVNTKEGAQKNGVCWQESYLNLEQCNMYNSMEMIPIYFQHLYLR